MATVKTTQSMENPNTELIMGTAMYCFHCNQQETQEELAAESSSEQLIAFVHSHFEIVIEAHHDARDENGVGDHRKKQKGRAVSNTPTRPAETIDAHKDAGDRTGNESAHNVMGFHLGDGIVACIHVLFSVFLVNSLKQAANHSGKDHDATP
jgi:hypothetical protein